MAVVLREVEHSDFDQIHSLFIAVYGKQPSDGLRTAFFEHDQLLGFCLIDTEVDLNPMVGYFGCFTFNRTIDGTTYKFYNSHTWIVKDDYRKHSLKLLMSYMRLKDGIITNFSANGKVAQILEQLKFTKLTIFNSIVTYSFTLKSYLAQNKIKSLELQSDITKWHQQYGGLSLNLKLPNTDQTIELILKPVNKKPVWVESINQLTKSVIKKPLVTKNYFLHKIHYTNAPDLLLENLDIICHYLFVKEKVGGLILPESLFPKVSKERIGKQYSDTVYVKSNQEKLPQIDYLYSEVFYLNIRDK